MHGYKWTINSPRTRTASGVAGGVTGRQWRPKLRDPTDAILVASWLRQPIGASVTSVNVGGNALGHRGADELIRVYQMNPDILTLLGLDDACNGVTTGAFPYNP